jgi:hypothetical protein
LARKRAESETKMISVTINPNFLKTFCEKLYSLNPVVIATRETLQNAHDAQKRNNSTKNIRIDLIEGVCDNSDNSDGYWVICDDRGIGMDAETIETKFLQLGGLNHTNESEVGGFGVGIKTVIFSSDYWHLNSLNYFYSSELLKRGEDIHEVPRRQGTRVECYFSDKHYLYKSDIAAAILMILASDVKVNLRVNLRGEEFKLNGAGLSKLPDGNIDKVSDGWKATILPKFVRNGWEFKGYNIYRLGGLVQFITTSNRTTNILIDIDPRGMRPADSGYPFTMSRESLNWDLNSQISGYLRVHDQNPLTSASIANRTRDRIKLQSGQYLSGSYSQVYEDSNGEIGADLSELWQLLAKNRNADNSDNDGSIATLYVNFNHPNADDRRILRVWTQILQIVANRHDSFGVGFIGDSDTNAERREYKDQYYYLINPNFARLNISTREGLILALWTLACHEVTHYQYSSHNEEFTSAMAGIMRNTSDNIQNTMGDLKRTTLRRYGQ